MKVHLSATTLHNCLYPGIIPDHLRSTIKTTPEADKLISIRAKQGPARNGRKRYKGPIDHTKPYFH